jgi:uncharacterized membrane protein (UPF0127 family)
MMFKKVFLPLILVAIFIGAVGYFFGLKKPGSNEPIISPILVPSKLVKIGGVNIPVELADTEEKRRQGLSGKTSLPENDGMLFIFDPKSNPNFWMKNMNFPIDIIWISDKKVVRIDKNAEPEPNTPDEKLKLYYSPGEIDHVLEVNAGFSDKNGLMIGDNVEYSL